MNRTLWLLMAWAILSSCVIRDEEHRPEIVITQHVWMAYYKDSDGRNIRHVLKFEPDGTGRELIWDMALGEETEDGVFFDWFWEKNYSQIRFEYTNHVIKYMTNVYVMENNLTGDFDGVMANFMPYL